jgi:hypothetical protein
MPLSGNGVPRWVDVMLALANTPGDANYRFSHKATKILSGTRPALDRTL